MPKSDRKNPTVLEIWLNQTRVGTLTNIPYDQNLFVFDDDYIRANDRPVLSLSFYDENRNLIVQPEQVQTRLPTFFSNLLPEGRLREYLAEAAGIKQIREFFLLWLLGTDLPGAVLAQDSEGTPLPPEDTATKAATEQRDERILRFSLAGVQLKFSAIGSPGKQLTIPAEGRGGAWIIKLPSPRYALVPENEYSMMKLAAAAGIDVAEVGLVPTNQIEGLPVEFSREKANSLYVRRFDRTPEGGRIHIEDFNQIYHQFPHHKYKRYSYTNMWRDISTFLGADAVAEFIRNTWLSKQPWRLRKEPCTHGQKWHAICHCKTIREDRFMNSYGRFRSARSFSLEHPPSVPRTLPAKGRTQRPEGLTADSRTS